jgi:hypothetical protein
MINENKTGKYLKYAIGEIVLVVIGILIALQINNWNESRKDKILEIEYLTRLKDDINFDISWLNKYILDKQDRKVKSLENGNAYYQGNYVIKDTLKFLNNIGYGGIYGNASWSFNTNTYNELLSTGNLRKIENNTLRTEIINYYEYNNSIDNTSKNYITGYIPFTNSFRAFNKNNPEYISEFDQKLLLKNINTEEYYRLTNLELTLAHKFSRWAKNITTNAENLISNIDTQLED